MIQLFPPERVSERMVYKSSTSQCLKFLLESSRSSHPEAWDPLMESFTA